jgi:hypothetical protein
MSKERGITDYLKDDWSGTPPGGTNASGVDETPNYDESVPYRSPMPEHKDWQVGGFGHSDDCKDTGTKSSVWGMDKDEVAQGYERGKSDGEGSALEGPRQPDGSFPQSIPENYTGPGYNRGAGCATRAREFSKLGEGEGFDGVGNDKPAPGKQQIGSRQNLG